MNYKLVDTRHGPFLANPNDMYVGTALLRYGEYSEPELQVELQLLSPSKPGIIVEVGANCGAHTIPLARHRPMMVFEPQRLIFQQLCANLALNGIENVDAIESAVGNELSFVPIPVVDYSVKNNFGGVGVTRDVEVVTTPVWCTTLDDAVHPDALVALLKIDVEGFELQVLQGGAALIRRTRPVIYIENDRPDNSKALIQHLKGQGYKLWWHMPPMFSATNFNGIAENVWGDAVSCNMICVPAEHKAEIACAPVTDDDYHPFRAATNDQPVVAHDGGKEWWNNGERANTNDQLTDDGDKEWYRNGKLHREDGPTVEYADGGKVWYRNDKLHREDGPAIEWADGRKEWYRNGKLHRDDGPAVEYADGGKVWYRNGELHREDGPAVECADGRKYWYRNGERVKGQT